MKKRKEGVYEQSKNAFSYPVTYPIFIRLHPYCIYS